MHTARVSLAIMILTLATGSVVAQTLRLDRNGGFSFRFDKGDRRGDVEGKRANCEVYARIAQVQADANPPRETWPILTPPGPFYFRALAGA